MTVGFGSFNQFGDKATADFNVSFVPGVTPAGVIVLIVQNTAGDGVVGVTYGSLTLTEVAGSPYAPGASEPGVIHGFFGGSAIPTGTQTVAVDVNDATAKTAVVIALTAATDTEVVDTSVLTNNSLANPSLTLSGAARDCFYAAALHSGLTDVSLATVGTGCTVTEDGAASTRDFGAQGCRFSRRTTVPETGDQAIAWTASAEDVTFFGLCVSEVSGAAPAFPMFTVPDRSIYPGPTTA